ncbi:MAG: hypothetical protein QME12_01140 [Nanoarchaeota archaeon]|nr:hypothetical protein [Nanoarchaeota archaeon]
MRDAHRQSIESKISWDYGDELGYARKKVAEKYGDTANTSMVDACLTQSFQKYLNGIGLMLGLEFSHLPEQKPVPIFQPRILTYGVASIGNRFENVEISVFMQPYSENVSHYGLAIDLRQPKVPQQSGFFAKRKEDLLEIAAIPGVNSGRSCAQELNYEELEKKKDAEVVWLNITSNVAFVLALTKLKEKFSRYKA